MTSPSNRYTCPDSEMRGMRMTRWEKQGVVMNLTIIVVLAVVMSTGAEMYSRVFATPVQQIQATAEYEEPVVETVVVARPREEFEVSRAVVTRRMEITAYTQREEECGKPRSSPNYGRTASGVFAKEGVTVAAGRSFPFGTEVYIEGVGRRIVQDRGGAIGDYNLDLFFDESNLHEAFRFGRQVRTVHIIKWGDGRI